MLGLVPDLEIVSDKPEPMVAITELGDSAVTMELIFYITTPRELVPLRWRLLEEVLVSFAKNGIVITYPKLDVNVQMIPAAPAEGDEGADLRLN